MQHLFYSYNISTLVYGLEPIRGLGQYSLSVSCLLASSTLRRNSLGKISSRRCWCWFSTNGSESFFIILGGISSKEKLGPNGHGSAALVRTAAGCHRKNFLVRNLTFAELWREGEEKFLPRKIFLLLRLIGNPKN